MWAKKTLWISLSIFTLVASFPIGVSVVQADSDNPIQFYIFTVYSPVNRTYNSRFLSLNLSFTAGMGVQYTLQYYIDGKYVGDAPFSVDNPTELHVTYQAHAFAELPPLSEGSHSLRAVLICAGLKRSLPSNDGTVYFTIDSNTPDAPSKPTKDSTPPEISISWENRSYNSTDAPLNFTVNESTTKLSYSLDRMDNVTIAGNTTLTGLSVGAHNVTIYAWDEVGNVGVSKTVNFDVADLTSAASQPSEPFMTALIVASPLAGVAIFAAGILVHLKKRKHPEPGTAKSSPQSYD